MKEFIFQHKEISWAIFVIALASILIFTTRNLLKITENKWKRGKEFSRVFNVLRRVVTSFLVILAVSLMSYLFFEKESYELINKNILRIVWIALVIATTVILVAIFQSYYKNKVDKLSKRDKGDVTTFKYLNYLTTFVIYFVGILLICLSIPSLRNFAASAAAGAGVFALVAGVAAQEAISNLVGGLFIAFFKPFRIHDIIKIDNTQIIGRVEDINLRHTIINNFQNKRVVVPNAIINKENIVNYSFGENKICEWIEVGVAYDSNLDQVINVIREECESHPFSIDNRTEFEKNNGAPMVDVQVIKLDESSINLRAWVWSANYLSGFKMRNELFKKIKERFDSERIIIPFPQRTVHLKQ